MNYYHINNISRFSLAYSLTTSIQDEIGGINEFLSPVKINGINAFDLGVIMAEYNLYNIATFGVEKLLKENNLFKENYFKDEFQRGFKYMLAYRYIYRKLHSEASQVEEWLEYNIEPIKEHVKELEKNIFILKKQGLWEEPGYQLMAEIRTDLVNFMCNKYNVKQADIMREFRTSKFNKS